TGAAAVQVSAHGPASESGEGTLLATFSFADGSVGTLAYVTTGDRACPKERIELFADGRVVLVEDFRSVTAYVGGRPKVSRRFVQEKGFLGELEAFVQAVRSGAPAPVPFSQIHATTLATLKTLESLRRGVPVPIEIISHASR
ncbi:MAG: oxidoreductase, partial [Candidatus Omnitrophica bacterium]|nr:oxidoreductase [Candidatus Omnitrophota bacterium]